MVTITQPDGSEIEYIVIDDDSIPYGISMSNKNMKETLIRDDVDVKQKVTINKANTTIDEVRDRLGNQVASVLQTQFDE